MGVVIFTAGINEQVFHLNHEKNGVDSCCRF